MLDWLNANGGLLSLIYVLVSLGMLAYVVRQLKEMRIIHEDNHEWNRRNASIELIKDYAKIRRGPVAKLQNKFKYLTTDVSLDGTKVKEIFDTDAEIRIALTTLLNFYENLAVGISHGVFDDAVLHDSLGFVIPKTYDKFKPFIQQMRIANGIADLYCELEWLVSEWTYSQNKKICRKPTGSK